MLQSIWTRCRSFVLGFLGALVFFLIVGLFAGVWILWHRAYNGQAAYEYILKVQELQQQQARPAQAPAPKPGG